MEAAEYYARIRAELGGRFYDELEGMILDIRRQPDRFRLFDAPARRHFSDVFPYAVIYLDEPGAGADGCPDAPETRTRLLAQAAVKSGFRSRFEP